MASKKFYSDDDIQLAKAALSELPASPLNEKHCVIFLMPFVMTSLSW